MIENLPTDSWYYAAAAAAFLGLLVHYLYYESFIRKNYEAIVWFRRLLMPHLAYHLRQIDEDTPNTDLSKLYIETDAKDDELALRINVEEYNREFVQDKIEKKLMREGFRPEVLLTSIAEADEDNYEIGNWVLTGPRRRSITPKLGRIMFSLFMMFTSKWQLHVRIFYDEDEDTLDFYAHHEYNPYCPLYAKKHFNGEHLSAERGKHMFQDMVPEITRFGLNSNDYEVVK